ncbi:hypothetical protein [Nostoc sp. NMS4]|uniref:hypothetical protein n=1 Tax=Nostoc sp. NMS4 TaxID=2815390 RepID=UPI0025E16B83|nr:hypothetical protein [Nostoc sp. NMS4]
MLQIKDLGTEKLLPDDSDLIPIQEIGGTTRHIKRGNFIAGISGGISNKYIQLLDSRPNGTAGGTAIIGSWANRKINTLAIDELETTSLANDIFTLDAGVYRLDCITTYYKGNFIRTRLFNISDNAAISNVFSVNTYNGAEACTYSILKGKFTIETRQQLSIQYRVSSSNGTGTGLGEPCNFGQNEIFLLADIWKL